MVMQHVTFWAPLMILTIIVNKVPFEQCLSTEEKCFVVKAVLSLLPPVNGRN